MDRCVRCQRVLAQHDARWFFPVAPRVAFSKCQACGPWTEPEKQVARYHFEQRFRAKQATVPARGCGCNGRR